MDRIARSIAYLKGGGRFAPGPLEIVVELTNRCALRCPICPRDTARRPVGDMPWDMFRDLVEQAERLGIRLVDLCLAGESLLHPRILDAVREVKSRGMLAYVQTSAAHLDEPLAHGLVDAGIDMVSFSIDAVTPETYAKVRPGGDFDRVTAAVEHFLDLGAFERQAGRQPPFTIVQMILQEANAHEADAFRRRWLASGAGAVRLKPLGTNQGLRAPGPRNGGGTLLHHASHAPPCTRPWRGMAVTWAGHVLACCYDFEGLYPLGDAARESLASVWSGERLVRLRSAHAQGKAGELDVCRACSAPGIGPATRLAAAASLLFDERQVLRALPWLGRAL